MKCLRTGSKATKHEGQFEEKNDERRDLRGEEDSNSPHQLGIHRLELQLRSSAVHVDEGDVLGQPLVVVPGRSVEDEEEDVEPREKSGGKVDVLDGGDLRVVSTVERVGSSEDGRSSVKGGGDSGFGDGDGLLFHDFVNGGSIRLVHLVELVDAADSVVRENESSSL